MGVFRVSCELRIYRNSGSHRDNRVLGRILGTKREEITGRWRKL
jgi:hypothetical protein